MNALEIVLLVAGVICIVVSFIMSPGKDKTPLADDADATLDEKQKAHIRNQIDEVVAQQMENVSEQTEAHLDKISATKVMELNEYADTVLEEMNRNHNETMFLYDMLNEKSKEIKSAVRTINVTKQQVEKLCEETAKVGAEMTEGTDSATAKKTAAAPAAVKKTASADTVAKKTATASAAVKKTASADTVAKKTAAADPVKPEESKTKGEKTGKQTAAKTAAKKTAKTDKTEADSQTMAIPDTEEAGSEDEAPKPAPKKRGRKKKSEIEAEAQQAAEPETAEAAVEKKADTKEAAAQEKTEPKSRQAAEEADDTALDMTPAEIQDTFEDINTASAISRTQRILSMYKQGMEAKVIAKELGIGVGEVTLIIGLYK